MMNYKIFKETMRVMVMWIIKTSDSLENIKRQDELHSLQKYDVDIHKYEHEF